MAVKSGGYFLAHVVRGHVAANRLQTSFYRAGHTPAAVLLVLIIAILALIDQTTVTGFWAFAARDLVPISAILMLAGFFLSVLGKDPQKPNRFIWLLWIGAASLAVGLLTAGISLVVAGVAALP